MSAIRNREAAASGFLRSVTDVLEVALEYNIGLHPKLVSFDDLDVLRFEGENRFIVKIKSKKPLQPGTILAGSNAGAWCV